MKKDNNITKVQFFYHEENEDLFAFFPEENFSKEGIFKKAYSKVGQHSACHPNYAKESIKATPEQYKELKEELISIGYNLKIV